MRRFFDDFEESEYFLVVDDLREKVINSEIFHEFFNVEGGDSNVEETKTPEPRKR